MYPGDGGKWQTMLRLRFLYQLLLPVMPIRIHADIYNGLRNLIAAKTDSPKHDSTIPDNFAKMKYLSGDSLRAENIPKDKLTKVTDQKLVSPS